MWNWQLNILPDSAQAGGKEGITQRVIVKALPTIGIHLLNLFNASFARGIFPESWKWARLLATKKVSVPSTPSDFRSIELLFFLSEVLEKLVHEQITVVYVIVNVHAIYWPNRKSHIGARLAIRILEWPSLC